MFVLKSNNDELSLHWYYILDVPDFELKGSIFIFFTRVVFTTDQSCCKLPQKLQCKVIGSDRRRTLFAVDLEGSMWCLEDYQVRYLRKKLTKYRLTVVCRRSDKVVCRLNSLCFFTVHGPTQVSLEICTFRCLVGHVFQRSGPVDPNMSVTTVNMSQVMICPDLIWKITFWVSLSFNSTPLQTPFLEEFERCLFLKTFFRVWNLFKTSSFGVCASFTE